MKVRRLDSLGFSLPELLVTIVVFTVIMAVAGTLFANGARVFSREAAAVTHQNDLAAAKSILLDDLSIMGYGVAGNPIDVIDSASDDTDEIRFFGDVDSDTEDAAPGVAEKICYRWVSSNGGTLQRSSQPSNGNCGDGGWQNLASNVTQFNLSLLNSDRSAITDGNATGAGLQCWPVPNGAGLIPAADVNAACYVRVSLVASETIRSEVVERQLTGEVAIRN